MPKSRLRKDHKKKVANRHQQRVEKMRKLYNEFKNKQQEVVIKQEEKVQEPKSQFDTVKLNINIDGNK